MRKLFKGLIKFIIVLVLIVAGGLFAYKKICLDGRGQYGTVKTVYAEDYGICALVTYFPEYQAGGVKGFAITHVPFEKLFTRDYLELKDALNDSDLLSDYKFAATYLDNSLVEGITKLFSDTTPKSRSVDVGKNGRYFVMPITDIF